jgi:hypothetical protein
MKRAFKAGLLLLLVLTFSITHSIYAANMVSIDVAKSGNVLMPYDTLYVGGEYEVRVWIENDIILRGMTQGFRIWSDNGATWNWLSQPDGLGAHGYVSITPGSRLGYPNGYVFDMTGLLVTEQNIDTQGIDSIGIGGGALHEGLALGPPEHMYSWHFKVAGPLDPDNIHTICFDTTHIPPSGCMFCFIDPNGNAFMPLWGGQLCLPVKLLCGNPNGDNDVNVGDCVFMINYIFRGGPGPEPWQLGDANCDGTLDVGDVVFLIAASFRYGPQPECCE